MLEFHHETFLTFNLNIYFQNALYLCRECPFALWRPENGDIFAVVCRWLVDNPPAMPQNQLAR